ncbi:hemoglobin [Myroides guanonis]|uniref:Hemoglobin n=2 Tax=Myroides guanonis TaxID=1150112 RepID=A0A1I3RXK7_9FLAO|nr:hemoglobin [Myroides guanonis]
MNSIYYSIYKFMKKDIENLEDVKQLVNMFYERVRINELIGPIFNAKIQDRWEMHLQQMYNFWQTVLLEEHTYNGRPFPPHAHLPISQEHFDTWLELFKNTLDELFDGPKVEEAKWRANQMAQMFLNKIEYFKEYTGKTLL